MTPPRYLVMVPNPPPGPPAKLSANEANALKIMRAEITEDELWWDSFRGRVRTTLPTASTPLHDWTDLDTIRLAVALQNRGLDRLTQHAAWSAVKLLAGERPHHPLQEWLQTLVWDREPRLEHAFEDHWGTESSDLQPVVYLRAASENFFVSLVARAFEPGCKHDHVVIFEGPQGIGKSSALRVIGGEWFATSTASVMTKDFLLEANGQWLIALEELDAFNRAEVARINAILSSTQDYFRHPYARLPETHPRTCVFAGTTNRDDWQHDEMGGRRFWPVRCGAINLSSLAAARDQLFAEAVHRYRQGHPWWDMPPSATLTIQAARRPVDQLQGTIERWLITREDTTISELCDALHYDIPTLSGAFARRLGAILRDLGWTSTLVWRQGRMRRLWLRSEPTSGAPASSTPPAIHGQPRLPAVDPPRP